MQVSMQPSRDNASYLHAGHLYSDARVQRELGVWEKV
jgi:hypothetical protein